MDFAFSPDQEALAKRIREFTADRMAPLAAEADRTGRFRDGLFAELAAQELFALGVPTAYGGRGADSVSLGIALEELAAGDLTPCYAVLNAALIGAILDNNATAEQCRRWLPAVAAGESVLALCLTEPDHGTDAANVEMRADESGSGWTLHGVKTSTMLGAYATHGLVFARTGGAGARGVTAFFTPLDAPGITRTPLHDLGSRSGGRSTLTFDGVAVEQDNVIGGPGLGFIQVMRGFDYSRALIALMAVGAASASLREAFDHARVRETFGRPIGMYQGVAFPLVEHATALHMARLVAYEALWRKDAGLDHRKEANMAKWWAPKAAVDAAHQALLTFGHQAWSEDLPLARRLRDLIGTELGDGTAGATRLVLARQLLGRDHAP
ncbi:acyl-CoA dehydrogenase family protein [Actinomadura hibisca]|uniref:acyl-CoA dehydrogenase family protein n=1 Tax=Actinomadura hibisca TaxID=68565 RepID=UPI0008362438|nr:acyl-CoA dehydrogenase family protein [Actinomadura hibisca]